MYVIAGGTTANNRGFASRATTDPDTEIVRYSGITVRANMKVTDVELASEPQVDCLLPQIVAYIKGRVTSIYTGDFPGREGTMTEIRFGGGKIFTSDDETSGIADIDAVQVEEVPGFNDMAPDYVLRMRMSLAENYMVAAKGGFVPGYVDSAVPRTLINREWQNLPMDIDVTEFRCGDTTMYLMDIQNQFGRATSTAECGYDVAAMLSVAPEMQNDPTRVLSDELESEVAPVEYQTADDLAAQQLIDLMEEEDVELEPINDEPDMEAEPEAQNEPAHMAISTFAENPYDSELDQDMAFIANLFDDTMLVPGGEQTPAERVDQFVAEIEAEDDALDLGSDDFEEDETKTDGNKRGLHAALNDMAMEGASSVAEAQQNAAPVVADWSDQLGAADLDLDGDGFGF